MNAFTKLARPVFSRNEGTHDRMSRLGIGLVLTVVGFLITPWLSGFGLWVVFTGLVGWCPLYRLFGFSSCPLQGKR